MKNLSWAPATVLALAGFIALCPSNAAAQYAATNLVSNTKLYNPVSLDTNLINSWGLAALPKGPWWVSAQNSSTSTVYEAGGTIDSPVVAIPCVTNTTTGTVTVPCPLPGAGAILEPNNPGDTNQFGGGPTGIVANTFPNAFKIGTSGEAAQFIFDTGNRLIVAWNSSVNASPGVVVSNQALASAGALYQGLAIAGPASARTCTRPMRLAAKSTSSIRASTW